MFAENNEEGLKKMTGPSQDLSVREAAKNSSSSDGQAIKKGGGEAGQLKKKVFKKLIRLKSFDGY